MVNVGIIGCGKIAQVRHIPEYLSNETTKIVGIYDLNRERARDIATKYGIKHYSSYEELLADGQIDAVSICTANQTHAAISIAAMKAGKHVLCEKPMATTLEDCERMVEVARETGKILMIGQNQRLAKAHQKAKKLLEQGIIGKVISFRSTFGHGGPESWSVDKGKDTWFFDKEQATLGVMGDLGIHKTDLIQFLLGQKIVEVIAKVTTLDKRDREGNLIRVDDNAICMYTMENGAVGTMVASWTFYGKEDNTTIIYGTEGIMRIYDDPAYTLQIIMNNQERIHYEIEAIQTNEHQTKSGIIDLFIDAILDNTVEYIDGESVVTAMKAVFASVESSKEGRMIKIH